MDKVGGFIIRFRIPIIIVIAIAVGFSAYGITKTNINSDIMSYLPEGTDTTDGSNFLSENFGILSNAVYAVSGESVTYEQLAGAIEEAKEDIHVTDIMWLGSMGKIKVYGTMVDPFDLMPGGDETKEKLSDVFFKDGNYMLMITMDVGASTNEAGASLANINAALDKVGAEYVSGGTAPVSRKVYDDAISELPIYLSIAVVLVLIILFLVSANWLEPFVFMLTMGVSIVINMGTNFLFPEVSIITFCAASILQLALAMDYSIFLTQIYSEERQKGLPEKGAMISAIGTTLNTVFASALTTMGGFAAFFVMSFTLGADLGGVLIKGIFLAMLTVIVLQPCLLILLAKPMAKTGHKRLFDLKFEKFSSFCVGHRVVVVIIFALILAPALIGQLFLPLSYLNFMPKTEGDPDLVTYVSDTSDQIFLAVPVDPDDPQKNVTFAEDLRTIDGVTSVAGFFSFIPKEAMASDGKLHLKFGITYDLFELGMDFGYITEDGYTLYLVALSKEYDVESQEATDILYQVKAKARESFSGEKTYTTGVLQAVAEFREITPRDFKYITLISVAIIFIVLLISFRNLIYPFLLVLLIELGTWINFSISTIFNQSLNFLAYIVVGAIQLGATVDYAILITHKYRGLLKEGMDPLDAAKQAGTSCTMSILTSATILVAACASVTAVSSNAVIREVTMMCMRGAVISTLLVLFMLPSILASTTRLGMRIKEAGGFFAFIKKLFTRSLPKYCYADLVRDAKRRIEAEGLLGENERVEDLDARGLVIIQPEKGYRFNSDSVILANLAEIKAGEKVYDLGCGAGVMSLLVAAKKGAKVVGVELQDTLADMAKRSVRANLYEEKVEILKGDIRHAKETLPAGDADVILLNPPYYKEGSGEVCHDEMQAIARHEITVTINDELAAISHLLKKEGKAYVIFPTSREREYLKEVTAHGLTIKEKVYLTSSMDKAPESFITLLAKSEEKSIDKESDEIEIPVRTLVTKDPKGNMSKEVAALYRS